MEISESNKNDEKKDKGNDIGKMNINVLHKLLNHVGEAQMRATAKEGGTEPHWTIGNVCRMY